MISECPKKTLRLTILDKNRESKFFQPVPLSTLSGRSEVSFTKLPYLLFLLFGLLWAGCAAPAEHLVLFEGGTMGTSYHISYGSFSGDVDAVALADQHEVDSMLVALNQSLSTYIDTSLLSSVNASLDTTAWHLVDKHFVAVLGRSQQIHKDTDGAFEPAIGPLVDAYGFGPVARGQAPDSARVVELLQQVDFDSFLMDASKGAVQKRNPIARLDFSAIAKGYGVDLIADFFAARGMSNYFVEIGGEIRTGGIHPEGRAWRTGIEKPSLNSDSDQEMQEIVEMNNVAMATSGNYRNFYEQDGKKFVHIIDPWTGFSRPSSLLSVSVVAADCMTADAYATALMVMGVEKGLAFVESRPALEAFFISADDDGLFRETRSSGFPVSVSE